MASVTEGAGACAGVVVGELAVVAAAVDAGATGVDSAARVPLAKAAVSNVIRRRCAFM
jgi:hypothetical protein